MALDSEQQRIVDARHHDPFSVLGRHPEGTHDVVRVFLPLTKSISIVEVGEEMTRIGNTDFFEWRGKAGLLPMRYQLQWVDSHNQTHTQYDPYCFPPQVGDLDLHLFGEGKHWHTYRFMGSHFHECEGVEGVLFAVWAPNAERVSVIGDFNNWDGRRHPMRARGNSGVWELFVPGLSQGTLYKYEIRSRENGAILEKADPYGRRFEVRPKTAASVYNIHTWEWEDDQWLADRQQGKWKHNPVSVYEVHLGSWRRDEHGHFLNYRELAHQLVDYVKEMGFTHIELLPITEHPLDASWGYQTTGFFAPTSRFGSPTDFRYFVNHCHKNGIGVILDWVPGHFPKDSHALARFDGTPLFEHADPRRGEHMDWGTLIFNYGRNEVRSFLLSSAMYWLQEYHIDGLRVDAVASMLYLDYSRKEGEWIPNEYGGNENLEAIHFLRELNEVTQTQHPGILMIAEESTSWPQVTRPTWVGGLGFTLKWNMGWMNDTLDYFSRDPIHRKFHHNQLTFGLLYSFSENFMLPFSHDEVVHGKGSLLARMPGDEWQQFANLRLLLTYMFCYPGKKLLFMGQEFGQGREWSSAQSLDWNQLGYHYHKGIQSLVRDLNKLYSHSPALHHFEFDWQGFEWLDCNDATQSILSFVRKSEHETMVVTFNFTPVLRHGYRVGVPHAGRYEEVFNSDSDFYCGSNQGNAGQLFSEPVSAMGRDHSIAMTLPPLGAVVLRQTHHSG